jgi:hypothetical protein
MDNRNIFPDLDDIVAAYEAASRAAYEAATRAAIEAGVAAGTAAFRAALQQRIHGKGKPPGRDAILNRYRTGSWKQDVLRLIYRLTDSTGKDEFRFSDLARYEADLRKKHPDQKALMSGVNVTLQSLVKDGILRRSERGLYHVV